MPTIIYSLEEIKEIFNKIGIKADKIEIIELNDAEPGVLVKTSTHIAMGTVTEVSPATNDSISQPEEEVVEEEKAKDNKKRAKVDENIRKRFFSALPPDQVPEILSLDEIPKRSEE
jgi:uncharacterized protein (UPF0179 family)